MAIQYECIFSLNKAYIHIGDTMTRRKKDNYEWGPRIHGVPIKHLLKDTQKIEQKPDTKIFGFSPLIILRVFLVVILFVLLLLVTQGL